ncbi:MULTISPECIES: GNAT family N-acetyltransferase [unclassified Streptococcus]|uniref:GNAT family N-acetyltransferase n=1 Tax=unclassified Streptococcus TaxID=2608887 RepID=UPI000ADD3DD0|nr:MULTISPECIES: GNAT family N-acetyltransferase [unclassified Streptococcus]
MDKSIIIRHFQEADVDQLLPLFQDLGYETHQESLENQLRTVLANPDYALLVACQGEEIIGFIGYAKMYFF